jgi:hypothetical protein
MDEVFRVTDRWGRVIVLTQLQWSPHVLVRHPDLGGMATVVADALTDPAFVNYDRRYPDRELFYRPYPLTHPSGRLFVRVIVRFGAIGEVITAHLIPKPHRKERRKWP